jgi:hypothetical protein
MKSVDMKMKKKVGKQESVKNTYYIERDRMGSATYITC